MTQNNINLLLQNFFSKYPDIKKSRASGIVNRRALANYIIRKEKLDNSKFEALVTALRRFETKKEDEQSLEFIKDINISTKDGISIIYLEKSQEVLDSITKVISLINTNKNETLKFVQGSLSLKLFIDSFNLKKVENIFPKKDVISIYNDISELSIIISEKATRTKGVLSYLTSQLFINNINIFELLTGKPELIIYVEGKDLLKAYETIKSLKSHPTEKL